MVRSSLHECFGLSGCFKIIESLAVFTCLMLHVIGNKGQQLFFGASDNILHAEDETYRTEVDTEIIGAGTVMAFTIITPMMLFAYVKDSSKFVQSTSLDPILTFVGACLLVTAGGMCCFAWSNSNENNSNITRRDYEAAGALGLMCIATGIIYLIDFFFIIYRRSIAAMNAQ